MNKKVLESFVFPRSMVDQGGMTVLESLVAIVMLGIFTSVVALVMQFTLRFFSVADSGERNEFEVSNGVLIDHQQIHIAMDALVDLLSQPGITLERLNGEERCAMDDPPSSCMACADDFSMSCRPQIAFDLGSDPQLACPPALPEVILPPGYRFCLWKTTVVESSMSTGINEVKPGIYLLQALPEQLSSVSLPTRRLFCRPRPFCSTP